jgi:DNA polymerase-1
MSVTRPRLFLVDTFGLIFRAYYGRARSAVQAMRTSAGLPTEAVYVFNNMLKRILEDHRPEHIAAVWEGQGPTFRERIYPKYKANREKMPEDLATQLPYIKRLLECWNVPVLQEDGYEADDTIGRLAVHAAERGVDVWIVSSDKDLMQVVREGVALLDPMKKTRYQSSDVERFLGVKPEHVSDYLALRGDPVDNIPGAPGIGVKGAQQLIKAYGDIEQIIQHAGEVKRKTYRESLQNNAEQIRLSKRLASLDTAGSLRLDLEGAKQRPPDPDQLLEFYRELEFNSLAIQMEATFGQQKAESEARTFESAEEFRDWLDRSSGPLAIAVLGAEERRNAGTVAEGIGFSLGRGELWRLPAKFVPHARELLETGGREIWVHDWKSAIHALDALGIAFRKAADDTMLMAFLTDSSRTNYSLSKTVERRLGTKWEPDAAVAAAHTPHLPRAAGRRDRQDGAAATVRDSGIAAGSSAGAHGVGRNPPRPKRPCQSLVAPGTGHRRPQRGDPRSRRSQVQHRLAQATGRSAVSRPRFADAEEARQDQGPFDRFRHPRIAGRQASNPREGAELAPVFQA